MKVLQVKEYNRTIAYTKYRQVVKHWRQRGEGWHCPVESMFYYMVPENQGYSLRRRQKGYVAFDNKRSIFNLNKDKAINKYMLSI